MPQLTLFTGSDGVVHFDPTVVTGERKFLVRKQGYSDVRVTADSDDATLQVELELLVDDKLIAESKPANLWLSDLDFNWAEEPALAREHFLLHCGFCHQQASVFMRLSRTEEQWSTSSIACRCTVRWRARTSLMMHPAGLVAAYEKIEPRLRRVTSFRSVGAGTVIGNDHRMADR